MRSQRARLRAAVTSAAVVALVAATGPNGAAAPPNALNDTTASATPTGVSPGVEAGAQAAGESVLPASETLGATGTKVTLITGDVVSYSPGTNGGKPTVEVTSSRNASFTQVQEDDHYYVYPGDTRGLVGAGKLDKMLFDVAYLAKNGYADDKSKTLPVIVQYPKAAVAGRSAGPPTAAAAAASSKALSAKADALPATTHATGLSVVNAAAVRVDKADATKFWSSVDAPKPNAASLDSGVAKIWLDKKVTASLDVSVPQIGAPQAWAAGYDGTGVKVAVLDTGIDDAHPDFTGKIAESKSFIDGESTKDGFGHGTHVASIIVGSGAASDGKYKGVAPGAQLIVGKVLSNAGTGTESQVIAGMQWAAQSDAKIVSMSLGACCSDGTDPQAQAVNDLTAQYGTLFVIAAGNDAATSTIGSPGAADAALTVAAVDKQDQMAPFSSRGPRLGDAGLKPDIAGPGVDIVAARAEGTTMPGAVHVGDKYTTVSGTSMATPHVAGSAAILAQEHPDWSGQKIKEVLVSTSKDTGVSAFDQGAGRVDVARATTQQQVYATGGVAFGQIAPPYTAPAGKPLTYVNDGDTDVTLNLTTTAKATVPVPDGMFTTNPSTVTVPAHGTASVEVFFTIPTDAPNLPYGGGVHAVSTDGSITVNTAVGGQKKPRQAKLNLNIINRPNMADAVYFGYWLMRLDPKPGEAANLFSGPVQNVSTTVDAGVYAVSNDVTWRDKDGEWNRVQFTNPNVDATGDGEVNVTFDLRKAVQETVRTPKDSIPYTTRFGYHYQLEGDKGASGAFYELPYGATKIWSIPTPDKPSRAGFVAYITHYNGADPVKMTLRGKGGKVALHPQYQAINYNSNLTPVPMLDGRSTRQIVAAGAGHPEDYTGIDLRGKIALLDLSDICPAEPPTEEGSFCTTDPVDRVQAAKDAGAAAVLGYGTVGRQFLLPFSEVGRPGKSPTYPIPTMGLTANEGRMLAARLAKGPVTVDVDATEWSPYLYPLTWTSHEGLFFGHKTVTDRDLLRTDHRVHNDNPDTLSAIRWIPGVRIGESQLGAGSYRTVRPAPFTVASYLGPVNQEVFWMENVNGGNYSQSRYHHLTRAGSETQNWGEQPLVPNTYRADPAIGQYTELYCYSCRNGDILLSSDVLTNNGTTTGYIAAGNGADGKPVTEQHLYRTDGTEITRKEGFWLYFLSGFDTPYYELPAEPTDYRLTKSYTSPLAAQKWAPHVETERTFSSQRVTDGIMPDFDVSTGIDCMGRFLLRIDNGKSVPVDQTSPCQATDELYLGYDFGLALDNTLPADSRQNVTITGFGSPYLKTQPKLSKLTLSLSYDDGKTWQKIKVRANRNGTYTGTFTLPKLSTTTGAVTVRAEATDTHGNTVKQTIDRAFGLNPATHGHGPRGAF